jgi:hypothetical protein
MQRDNFEQITYDGHKSGGLVVVTQFSVRCVYVCPRLASIKPTFYAFRNNDVVQRVPLATEPGISLVILPLMRILQRNLKRTYLIV